MIDQEEDITVIEDDMTENDDSISDLEDD